MLPQSIERAVSELWNTCLLPEQSVLPLEINAKLALWLKAPLFLTSRSRELGLKGVLNCAVAPSGNKRPAKAILAWYWRSTTSHFSLSGQRAVRTEEVSGASPVGGLVGFLDCPQYQATAPVSLCGRSEDHACTHSHRRAAKECSWYVESARQGLQAN